MNLRHPKGARRYNEPVTLTFAAATRDRFGHASEAAPVPVLGVYAHVQRMSADKTLRTFQQADVVGVEVEFRTPAVKHVWNGLEWRGHRVHTNAPEDVEGRGRYVRVSGWYTEDNPVQQEPPAPTPNETSDIVIPPEL